MQEKSVYVVVDSKAVGVVKQSAKPLVTYLVATSLAAAITLLLFFSLSTYSNYNSPSSTKAVGDFIIPAWNNCTVGSTLCGDGFTCCIGPLDVNPSISFNSNKFTCRQAGLQVNDPSGCAASPSSPSTPVSTIIPAWQTCTAGSTCESGFTCCVAPADISSGKSTCRQQGLSLNDPSGCASSASPTTPIKAWETCFEGSTCESGFTCCVAPADLASGKRTCRQQGLVANDPSGCASTSTPSTATPVSSSGITAKWQDCTAASTCESGFTCCIAPADVSSSKTTCRQSGLALNDPSGCASPSVEGLYGGLQTGIGSWFAAIEPGFSNGNSWCNYPYTNASNGFAISLSVMTNGTNVVDGDSWKAYGRTWCGLEAVVRDPDTGISKTMYVLDAFAPAFVRSDTSIDIMVDSWEEISRSKAEKGLVIYNVEWYFTGGRSAEYSFGTR